MIAAALAITAPTSIAASFACSKASTPVERLVCGSPELSALDEHLGRYYAGARLALKHAENCLVVDQRSWVRTVRDACKTAACLKAAYLERLAVLHSVQPGASSMRSIELPRVPALVWIVPPATDEIAAPRTLPTRPLVVSGQIVNDMATGDGFVLLSEAGTKHVIVTAMLLDAPTAEALAYLARQANAQFDIRGRSHLSAKGAQPFADSQCTFVLRRP